MANFIHRILFIILIIPLSFLLVVEIIISLFIQIFKWIIFGNFNDDFILNLYVIKINDFFNFNKIFNNG